VPLPCESPEFLQGPGPSSRRGRFTMPQESGVIFGYQETQVGHEIAHLTTVEEGGAPEMSYGSFCSRNAFSNKRDWWLLR